MGIKLKNKANIHPLDIIAVILSITVIVLSIIKLGSNKDSEPVLVVSSPKGNYVYSLSENAIYNIQGRTGISIVEVKDGCAKFIDSSCPNKTCVQSKPVSQNGEWSACLPNEVFIRVENTTESSLDAVSF